MFGQKLTRLGQLCNKGADNYAWLINASTFFVEWGAEILCFTLADTPFALVVGRPTLSIVARSTVG